MPKVTRATKMLERAGIVFTVHSYNYDPGASRIGLQAAEALGEDNIGRGRSRARRSALAEARPWTARTPAPGDGHTHEAPAALRSIVYTQLIGSDQPLNGLNLISETALNVIEAGGRRAITAPGEERFHV